MKFEWDERKAATHFSQHAVRFEDAKPVFEDPNALELYQRVVGETLVQGRAQWIKDPGGRLHGNRSRYHPHHFGQRGYQG